MQGVIVEFDYPEGLDRDRVTSIAEQARGRFEGMPGLRQKTFTLDEAGGKAINVYLWDSEAAARGFFDDQLVERVTELYGVRPTIRYVEIAELVDNAS